MRDVRLWILASLVAMMAGCANTGNCTLNTCSNGQPAGDISVNGCGVEHQAYLDTGTVVRPAH
jgi:hypothetical protein